MANRAQFYEQMAARTAEQITGSYQEWTAFLATAARLYKYPYHEQLMIYAQRPEATACAEYDFWNKRMRRYVRRGSRGIALVDSSGEKPSLRYVFDVADTGGGDNARRPYDKWLGTQAKPSHRELLRQAIDKAMEHRPENLDALLDLLRDAGCEVSKRGTAYRLKLPGWEKAARLDSLGDGYTLEALLEIFAGQRTHTPGKKQAVQTMRPSVNLLVDIQAKLRAGKGAGYARWASKFNLKQMAQTLNYLNDHGLLDYKVLAEKTVAATARRNELSEKIKAAEKRMAEIAVLRTHIVNYAKTRDTYAAYRKAGYSPKFRSEHEADILLHQAAKQAFDQLNVKKLPKMKALQAEYAALLAEKKEAYAELRKARDEAQELLIVKANVDRILQNTERGGNAQEKGTVSFAANCALY